jgi:dipeptidyl aminopeptidase/acylaminoacyl peptidase
MLTVPFGDPPESGWPVVVFNHGYIRPDQYRTTERYVAYVDGFARNGYIVLRSDYRGHDNSEGVARSAYGAPDYTIDVLNAVAAIKDFDSADPNRIGMWGHSMGGFITLRSMVTSEDIRAGVIWAGVVASYPDLFQRWTRGRATPGPTRTPWPNSWRGSLTEIFGTPEENPKFWDPLSANSFLDEISGPIQLHHGTADSTVPLEFSQILYQQMEGIGGVAELYEYPGDNHNLSNYFTLAMQRSIDFFDRYVKNIEG